MAHGDTRQRQLRATPGERQGGVVLAVLAAIAFGGMWHDTLWVAAIGVALALFLTLASVKGHRALMAVAAFITGFGPWGFAYIFGAPYLGFAAFLLLRANRLDKSR